MKALASVLLILLALASPVAAQSIVIDPGHGGADPGGTGNNMLEKDLVLDTSKRFRDLLNADSADSAGGGSWTVNLTRDTDVFVSLAARSSYANSIGADRFMSIHANAFGNASANGTETFAYAEGGNGAALRNLVQEEMIAAWGLTNRGNKTANFSVLVNTAMPAELHELAFITNSTDAALLASADKRQQAAAAHLRAIQRHFGIAPYVPGSAPEPQIGSIAFHVSGPAGALVGASISIDGEASGTTDDSGDLLIAEVSSGEHLLAASAEGYVSAEVSVEVVANQEASASIELEARGDAEEGPDDEVIECDPEVESCDEGTGGCSTSGSAGAQSFAACLLLALIILGRRRRYIKCGQARRPSVMGATPSKTWAQSLDSRVAMSSRGRNQEAVRG